MNPQIIRMIREEDMWKETGLGETWSKKRRRALIKIAAIP